MTGGRLAEEVAAARNRSEALLQRGAVSGTLEPDRVALYMAVDELVHGLDQEALVLVVREGLETAVLEDSRAHLVHLARQILLAAATGA